MWNLQRCNLILNVMLSTTRPTVRSTQLSLERPFCAWPLEPCWRKRATYLTFAAVTMQGNGNATENGWVWITVHQAVNNGRGDQQVGGQESIPSFTRYLGTKRHVAMLKLEHSAKQEMVAAPLKQHLDSACCEGTILQGHAISYFQYHGEQPRSQRAKQNAAGKWLEDMSTVWAIAGTKQTIGLGSEELRPLFTAALKGTSKAPHKASTTASHILQEHFTHQMHWLSDRPNPR